MYTLTSFRDLPENCVVTAKQLAIVLHIALMVFCACVQERTENLANNSGVAKHCECRRGASKGRCPRSAIASTDNKRLVSIVQTT